MTLQLLMLNKVCCTCPIDTCSLLHACVSPAAMCSCIGDACIERAGPYLSFVWIQSHGACVQPHERGHIC